jgi:hypothetical protein
LYRQSVQGVSTEAQRVDESIREALQRYNETFTSRREPLELEFAALAAEWKADTEFESSPDRIAAHPAYRRLIEMGYPVLPLILKDLEKTHDDWFWALHAITGENPIRHEDRGIVHHMVSAWIGWGIRNNLL